MISRAEVLQTALDIWNREDANGPEYIVLLARTGLFNHMEIAKIVGVAPVTVIGATRDLGVRLPNYHFGMRFSPSTLDALAQIADTYRTQGTVPSGLVRIANLGNSIDVTARLTGVPIAELAGSLQP